MKAGIRRAPAADVRTPTRKFSFSYKVTVPKTPDARTHLRLWIPVPQSDSNQQISGLKVESPVKHALRSDGLYHNEFAYLDVPAAEAQKGLTVTVRFQAVRHEHRVALDGTPRGLPGR